MNGLEKKREGKRGELMKKTPLNEGEGVEGGGKKFRKC